MGEQVFTANLSNKGYVISENANVATARAGSNLFSGTTNLYLGFSAASGPNYEINQTFFEFDASAFTGVAAYARLRIHTGGWDIHTGDDGQLIEARLYDFGAAVTTADYRTPTNFNAGALLATYPMDDITGSSQWLEFTDVALLANINFSGTTRIVLCTDLFSSAGTPTERNILAFTGVDLSANPPELVIGTAGAHRMFLTF